MQLLMRTCNQERMNIQRVFARAFVALGGAVWIVGAFGASWFFEDQGLLQAVGTSLLPLAVAVATFLVGWFYERLAAALLGAGVLALFVWGVVTGWEAGVWGFVFIVLIAPMLIAATLFLLASRMQNICSLDELGTA